MWVILGILLGLMVLAGLLGFHIGPHSHAIAGGVGGAAAIWMVVMAFTGHAAPVLWVLLAADLVVSAGIAYLAWKGLMSASEPSTLMDPGTLRADAVATVLTELDPAGVVSLGGEHWSAVSLNGAVRVGEKVRVVGRKGVRLEVWRDEETPASELFELGEPAPPELFNLRRPAEQAVARGQVATPSPPDTSSADVTAADNESEEPRQWKSE